MDAKVHFSACLSVTVDKILRLIIAGCLTLLEVLEILEFYWKFSVSEKLPGSVRPFVVNVPDSSSMSTVTKCSTYFTARCYA